MGKYSSYTRKQEKPRQTGVHPVMRGLGCILIIVVPIFSYLIAVWLVSYGQAHGWPIPPNWYGQPSIHPLLRKLQGLQLILQFIQAQNNLEANLIFAAAIMVVVGGVLSMIYGYMYTFMGPPRYGPQDAPPIKSRKARPYKR